MFVLGGYSAAKRRLNDAHILDMCYTGAVPQETGVSSAVWIQPKIEGNLPEQRAGHCALSVDDSIIIFGGSNSTGQRLGDTHILDTRTMRCCPIKIRLGERPPGRSYQAAGLVGRRLYILGGFDGVDVLKDVWYLDIGKRL